MPGFTASQDTGSEDPFEGRFRSHAGMTEQSRDDSHGVRYLHAQGSPQISQPDPAVTYISPVSPSSTSRTAPTSVSAFHAMQLESPLGVEDFSHTQGRWFLPCTQRYLSQQAI